MKRQAFKGSYVVIAIFLAFLIIFPLMVGGVQTVSAATSSYTLALDDLFKDDNFNPEEYPENAEDYSLNVIQIAESTEGELLIYVYQPAANEAIQASSIKIARELDNSTDLNFKKYRLEYLTSTGVFFKYRVQNFEVKTYDERYYNISSILRSYNPNIDEPPADGQIITEMPNKVAQFWTACTVNDVVTYTVQASEVIEITQKVVGYCTYDDGLNLGWGAMQGVTKAYFVAFDTDRPIDKLISADLSFWTQSTKWNLCVNDKHDHDFIYDMHDVESVCYGLDYDFGENTIHNPPLTINYTQKFSNEGGGNWIGRPANTYTWNRIRSTADFISDNNNEDYQLQGFADIELSDTKWVLNFYEAHDRYCVDNVWLSFVPGVTQISGVADGEAQFEFAYDLTILRLEFETNGERYNLGVVDNVQTGTKQFNEYIGGKSGCAGSGCGCASSLPWWAWVLLIIFLPVIVVLLYKLITAPFKKLAKRRQERRAEKQRKKKQAAQKKRPAGNKRKRSKGGKK